MRKLREIGGTEKEGLSRCIVIRIEEEGCAERSAEISAERSFYLRSISTMFAKN
jgi:hypothetical protein